VAKTVHRTARIDLRLTAAQRRRLIGMLVAGGDVWAGLIELNAVRFRRRGRPILGYVELCRELAGVSVGELDATAMRSVARRYSAACVETARRKRAGQRARYPRRRRALVPLRWYRGTFCLDERRVRLGMAKGRPACWVRLCRPIPYPPELVRSVTLGIENGRLFLDVTARLAVPESTDLDPALVAGVDLGIIHPYAVACDDAALVVSGRALRAEERMHLEDTKRRAQHMAAKAPRRGQRGSRRWRKLRAAQRRAEARHRRRIRLAHHEAAVAVVAFATEHGAGTLVIGDPRGITERDVGRHQNLRLRQWRRQHLLGALSDKAEAAGMVVARVDERGTSSTCPECARPAVKPKGRAFHCRLCGYRGHRDVVGARNIAARGGGSTSAPALVTHRRAGTVPARRDRRRQLFDDRRSCPTPGRPEPSGSRSSLVACQASEARITESTGRGQPP
jgi:IS605 OrfB family transposase